MWYARWVRDGCPLVARATNGPAVVINNHSVGVHVQPPGVFDVETNVRPWLKQLNLYLQRNEIRDERVKIDVLVSRLSDRVGNLLEERVQALGSYDEISDLLIRTFDKEPRSPMHYLRLMGARVQRPDEGVQYYYADLATLANKAFPRLAREDRNWIIAQKFVDGLNNKAIQDKLAFDEFEALPLEEILKRAERMESGSRRAVALQPPPYLNANANAPVAPYFQQQAVHDACFNCGNRGHMARECPNRNAGANNYNARNGRGNVVTDRSPEGTCYAREIAGQCEINGRIVDCFIDTGATHTTISARVFEEELRSGQMQLHPCKQVLFNASGKKIELAGTVRCEIKIGDSRCTIDAVISSEFMPDCLIGMDVLMQCPSSKDHIIGLKNMFGERPSRGRFCSAKP